MLYDRPVNISINASPMARINGYLWSNVNGKPKSIGFIIDKPTLVKRGFNPTTYDRVIRQLNKMGINPDAIELHSENMKYIYDGHSYKNKTLGIPMSQAEIRARSRLTC